MTKRQEQAIATKRRILEVSSVLFRENGYDTVKVTDICEKAGLSVGAFYHHFRSKEDILDQGYKGVDTLLKERFEERTFENAREGIRAVFEAYCEIFEEIGCDSVTQSCRHMMTDKNRYALCRDRFVYSFMRSIISDGVDKNEIVSVYSKEEILSLFFRLFHGVLFDWCLHDGRYSLKDRFMGDLDMLISRTSNDLYIV